MPPMMPMPRNTRIGCDCARPNPPIEEPGAEEQRGGGGGGARAAALDPGAAERGAQAEEHERGGERRVGRAEPPGRIRKELLNRPVERAPRVDRADADVDEDGSDRDAPAMLRHSAISCRECAARATRTRSRAAAVYCAVEAQGAEADRCRTAGASGRAPCATRPSIAAVSSIVRRTSSSRTASSSARDAGRRPAIG